MSSILNNNGPFDDKNKRNTPISNDEIEKMFQSIEEHNRYSPEDLINKEKINDSFKRPESNDQVNINKKNKEVRERSFLSPEIKDSNAAPTVLFNREDFMKNDNFNDKTQSSNKIHENNNSLNNINTQGRKRRRGNYSQVSEQNNNTEITNAFLTNKSDGINNGSNELSNMDLNKARVNRNDYVNDAEIEINSKYPSADGIKNMPKLGKTISKIILIIIIILFAIIALFKFINFDKNSFLYNIKSKIESIMPGANDVKLENFSSNTDTSGFVGDNFIFSVTTSKNVKNVRIIDSDNTVLDTVIHSTENDDVIIWTIDYNPTNNYKGTIWPQLYTASGEWVDMKENSININIEAQVTATPIPETTDEVSSDNSGDEDNLFSDTDDNISGKAFDRTPVPSEIPTAIPKEVEVITPTPILTITATPSPTIVPTNTPEPTAEPTATPLPTASPVPVGTANAAEGKSADEMKIISSVYTGKKKVSGFTRTAEINMPDSDYYRLWKEGIFTFRGDAYHQNASQGSPKNGINENTLKIAWSYPVGGMQIKSGSVYGFGYMSQPAIIKWYKEAREFMNFNADKKDEKGLTEVIYASQDGNIYFLDLADGKETREKMKLGFPMNSAVSVYPSSIPIFSVGQNASFLKNRKVESGFRLFSLLDQKRIYFIDGKDKNAYFSNATFDGTALFDRFSDSMVVAGENGVLYTVMLNSDFKHSVPSLSISPTIDKFISIKKGQPKKLVGKESSVSMLGKYAYMADSSGLLQCVDVNTMSVVWATELGDNVDTTIAIDVIDENNAYLYLGNTLQNRNKGNEIQIFKINAYTGETIWSRSFNANYSKKKPVGALASPVVGNGILEDIVIFTISDSDSSSYTIALNKDSGEEIWKKRLEDYSVSSPIVIYEDANAFEIQGDSSGNLYMIDAKTGEELHVIKLDGAIESSPAAYNGNIVVGTNGGKDKSNIYCITIN